MNSQNTLISKYLTEINEMLSQYQDQPCSMMPSDLEIYIFAQLKDKSRLSSYLEDRKLKSNKLQIQIGDDQMSQMQFVQIIPQKIGSIFEEQVNFISEATSDLDWRVFQKQRDSINCLNLKNKKENEEDSLKSFAQVITIIKILEKVKFLSFFVSNDKLSEDEQKKFIQLFCQKREFQSQLSSESMFVRDSLSTPDSGNDQITLKNVEEEQQELTKDELINTSDGQSRTLLINFSFDGEEKNRLIELLSFSNGQSEFSRRFWSCCLFYFTQTVLYKFFSSLKQFKEEIIILISQQEFIQVEQILKQLKALVEKIKIKFISKQFHDILILLTNESLYTKYKSVLKEFQSGSYSLTEEENVILQTFQYFKWMETLREEYYSSEQIPFATFRSVYTEFLQVLNCLQIEKKNKFIYFFQTSCLIYKLDICISQYNLFLLREIQASTCELTSEIQLNYLSKNEIYSNRIKRIVEELKLIQFEQSLINIEYLEMIIQYARLHNQTEIKVFYEEYISNLKQKVQQYIQFLNEYSVGGDVKKDLYIHIIMNLCQIFESKTLSCKDLVQQFDCYEILLEKLVEFISQLYFQKKVVKVDLLILLIKLAKTTNRFTLSIRRQQFEVYYKYEEKIIAICSFNLKQIYSLWEIIFDLDETKFFSFYMENIENINLYILFIDLIIENASLQIDQTKVINLKQWRLKLNQFITKLALSCQSYFNQFSQNLSNLTNETIEKVCLYRQFFKNIVQVLLIIEQDITLINIIVNLIDYRIHNFFKFLIEKTKIEINLKSLKENSNKILQTLANHSEFKHFTNLHFLFQDQIISQVQWYENYNILNSYYEYIQIEECIKNEDSAQQIHQNTFKEFCQQYEKIIIQRDTCNMSFQEKIFSCLKPQNYINILKIFMLNKVYVNIIIIVIAMIYAPIYIQKLQYNAQNFQQQKYYNFQDEYKQKQSYRDQFGNPLSSSFDLAKDHQFNEFSLIIGMFYAFDLESYVIPAIKEKGIKNYKIVLDEQQFINELPSFDQAWIISGTVFANRQTKISDFTQSVQIHLRKQKGLALWADNDPYYFHANIILNQIDLGYENQIPIKMQLKGYYSGEQILNKGSNNQIQQFGPHLITTGLENLYEGNTICAPKITSKTNPLNYGDLEIIGTSSDNLPCFMALPGKSQRGRIVIDCGFTKLFNDFWNKTAGTQRYVKNLYAWLFWIEKPSK